MELMTMSIFGTILGSFRGSFRDHFWDRFLTSFWLPFGSILAPFWLHVGPQIGSGGAKTALGEDSRAPKQRKGVFPKTIKNLQSFKVSGVQRPPKRGSGSPRSLPRITWRAPRPQKKGKKHDWFLNSFETTFGEILGPFWEPFWRQNRIQNRTKNETHFWNTSVIEDKNTKKKQRTHRHESMKQNECFERSLDFDKKMKKTWQVLKQFVDQFGLILGTILALKSNPKQDKKRNPFLKHVCYRR